MRQLRLLTTVLLCLCFIAETDAQTPDDSEDVVTVRIDSIIYPRIKMKEEEEQISRSDTVYAYMYNIYYHYYKNGEKTWLINNVLGNDGSSADEVRFDVSDSDFTGYMTFDDVMRGLRYVVADANKRYGIRKRFQIWINTLDFGEESVELCRIYDKKRHKIRHDFSLFKRVFLESGIFRSIKDMMKEYGMEFEDCGYSDFARWNYLSPDAYVRSYGYKGDKETLPEKMIYSWDYIIEFVERK